MVEIDNRNDPEFPPQTVEQLRYYAEHRPKDSRYERYIAEQAGRVAGYFALRERWWLAQPGIFSGRVVVDQEHWGQGIGTHLYDVLLERAVEHGAKRLYGRIRDDRPRAERFVLQRGFSRTGRVERQSRLDVRAVNLDGYDGLEEGLRSTGIHIATLAELGADDEEVLHGLHELSDWTSRDMPSSEESGSTPCELWHQEVVSGPGMSPDTVWVALDGDRPVGIALLQRVGERAMYNDYTGVDRAYRGRGVARALKLRTIEWSRANGVDFIYTGNDVENTRMLAINVRLGYQPLPAFCEVVKEL